MRITVIGAGIVGSAIAFHLARRGAQVTLLDAGEPGMGASSHSFAWINAFGKEPRHYNELNRRSLDTWDRYARLLNADVGLKWGGQLTWTATDEDAEWLRENVAKLQSWGYIARLIDEAEMVRLEPGLCPGPVSAAAISENDGHVLGTKAAQVASRRVVELGGVVRSNTPALGLDVSGKEIAAVQVESESIDCDAVVLAAGVATTADSRNGERRSATVREPGSRGEDQLPAPDNRIGISPLRTTHLRRPAGDSHSPGN